MDEGNRTWETNMNATKTAVVWGRERVVNGPDVDTGEPLAIELAEVQYDDTSLLRLDEEGNLVVE